MADLHNLFSSHPDINSLKERKDFRGLIRALKHRDPQVQFDASAALSDLGSEGVTHLIDGLTSRSRDTRLGIIEALGEIKDRSAVDPLIRLLKDRDIEIRWEAALALGEIGDTRAVQPLKEALGDPNRYVRYGAAVALDKLGWTPASLEEHAFLLNGRQEWETLAAMGEEAIKPLSVSSIDLEPAVRVRAVETLGDVGGKKAIPPLYKALSDSDGQVRWEAVLAAPKAGIPIKFLPRALARRPRMRRNPYIAGLLNFLIPGIGYFWLGNWWGVIIFQMDIYLTLLLWQVYGESVLDFLLPIYLILGIHAWYMARNMPDL